MPVDSMSPRERWNAVLSHATPDRVPMDYWGTGEATAKILKHLGCATEEEMFTRLHIDRPVCVGPRYVGPAIPADSDEYGCKFREVDYGTGSYRECTPPRPGAFHQRGGGGGGVPLAPAGLV